MAAVFAVTGAVVAEYVGADRGLGYLSSSVTAEFRTDRSFAAIALLALIGLAFFGAVALAERLALPHRRHAVRPAWRPPMTRARSSPPIAAARRPGADRRGLRRRRPRGPEGAQRADLILDWFPNADHAGVYGAIDGATSPRRAWT